MRLAARLMAIVFTASLLLPALIAGPVSAVGADHFSVIVSPTSGTAGDAFNVTVTALDNTDATDIGYAGEVHFTSTDTGSSTLLPPDYTFDGGDAGEHTFVGVVLTTAGNRTITATDTATSSITGTSASVAITADVATQIDLTGLITNLASGVGRTFTATIQDQYANTVLSDDSTLVSFDQTSGAGTVTGEGTATASNGVATKVITGHLVGSVTITASASGLSSSNTRTFSVVPGAASQIDLTGGTANLTAGTDRLLIATIKDAVGNVETGDNSTVVAFAETGGAGTVTGLSTGTASSGVAQVLVTGGLLGSVDIEATAGALTSNTLSFTVTIGSANHITLTGSTSSLASGATRILTATIKDAGGNTITSDSTTDISFGQTGGTGSVSGEGGATASSGVATKTLTGQLVGSVSITATAGGLSASSPLTFNVTPGAAAQIVLSGATTNLTSGTTRPFTATIEDAAGNTVTTDNSTVVTFAKSGGTGTVSGLSTDVASSGVASITVSGALIGSVDIEATAGAITSNTLSFTVVVGAPASIALSGVTTSLASGTTRTLTATIKDAAGNTVTTDGSTIVSFSQTAGAGSVTGGGTATASSGVASRILTGQLIGSVTVTATASGLTDSNTVTFTVVPGTATQIVLVAAPANLTSGTTRVVTATLKDAAGNTETGDSGTIVTFAKSGGTGTVSGLGNGTVSSGVATVTVTGVLVGGVDLEATAGPLTSNTQTFTVTVGAASQIVLSGLTTNLLSGSTRLLTATIEDAAGNPQLGDSTTIVTFTKTTGAGTVTGLGPDTASGGVAQVTVTGVLVGSLTIHATGAALTSNTLTFTVAVGPATQITLSGTTTSLASGSTRILTATLKDAAGNVEAGDGTTVVTFGKASGIGTVTGLGGDTAAAGVASVTVTGALVGSIDIEATASALTSNTLTFTVVFGPLDHIVLSPPTATVDPGINQAYTVEAFDLAGNSRGDVTAAATLSIDGGGSCDNLASTCHAIARGAHTVTATYLTKTDTAIQTINNIAPVAVADTPAAILEDAGATSIAVLGNDSDANGDALTVTDKTNGAHGTVVIAVDGLSLTYTPAADYNGPDTFTYEVSDGLLTDTATVTVSVTAVNDAPSFTLGTDPTVAEDAGAQSLAFAVGSAGPANESAQTLTYVVTADTNPTLFDSLDLPAIAPDGTLTFTPAADANGSATISVHVVDSGATGGGNVNASSTQTFVITVSAVNDAPSFTLGTDPTVAEDAGAQSLAFAVGSAGPANESAQTLTYVVTADTNPTLFDSLDLPAIAPDGTLTFTPAADANGSATISVHVVDSGATGGGNVNASSTQTFVITVSAVNDAPVAVADGTYQVKQGTATSFPALTGVLANDTDVDNLPSALTAVLDTQGANGGTITMNVDGSFTYTPLGTYVGPDTFTYHANDGTDDSNVATVTINVYINHAPTALGDVATVVSGSGYVPLSLLVNDNAANPDPGETLHISRVSNPPHGTAIITGGGTGVSYRPDTAFIGSDLFTYTITDGVFSSSATVLVKVPKDTYKPVVTAPVQVIKAQSIGTSTVSIYLSWTGTDKGYGISTYEVWQSVNGHAYTKVKTTSGRSYIFSAHVGTTYRFRVRAIDKKGNVGAFATGPSFKPYLYQESSVTYSVPWIALTSSVYSGGHDRVTVTSGESATFSTTGRTFAWVSVRGSVRGTADVFVDGVLKAHVNLAASATAYRYVAYSITFTSSAAHVVQVVFTGPVSKRLDVDAFVVLR